MRCTLPPATEIVGPRLPHGSPTYRQLLLQVPHLDLVRNDPRVQEGFDLLAAHHARPGLQHVLRGTLYLVQGLFDAVFEMLDCGGTS